MGQKVYDVFISHASENINVALTIVKRLESQGICCFIAPRDMEPGRDYAENIVEAIEQSKVTVLVFSNKADRSAYVLREVNSAVLHSKTILPFRIEDILPSKSMEFYLGITHWLDAFPEILDKHIEALVEKIKQICSCQAPDAAKKIVYDRPIMLDYDNIKEIGYDMKRIILETIEIDYLTVDSEDYIINEEVEGTVEDWLDDCSNFSDSFSLLVVSDNIVGYWRMSMISESNFNILESGEKIITASMSEFYDFGGEFYVFIGLMPIIKEYETSANYMLMLEKLFNRIVEMHDRDISVAKIGISVYTDIVEKIITRLGFEYKGINPAKGKVFVLTPDAIRENKVFASRYPAFYELYTNGHCTEKSN